MCCLFQIDQFDPNWFVCWLKNNLNITKIIKSESKSNASCIPLIFQILLDSCRITLSFCVTSNSTWGTPGTVGTFGSELRNAKRSKSFCPPLMVNTAMEIPQCKGDKAGGPMWTHVDPWGPMGTPESKITRTV